MIHRPCGKDNVTWIMLWHYQKPWIFLISYELSKSRRKDLACKDLRATARQIVMGYRLRWAVEPLHKCVKPPLGFEDVATHGCDAVSSHVHWVYCAYILLHRSPPGLSPEAQSIGDKQRALQQGLADKAKRHILQQLTPIGGVQRYKNELRQALAGP